jgi:dienelactone hydrolase
VTPREQAVERLSSIGVLLALPHGSVEELREEVRKASCDATRRLYNPANQCHRKVRYEQPEDAAKAARRIERDSGGDPVRAYPCGYCAGGWHVGKAPKEMA